MTDEDLKRLLRSFITDYDKLLLKLKDVENDPGLSPDEKFDKMALILRDLPMVPALPNKD